MFLFFSFFFEPNYKGAFFFSGLRRRVFLLRGFKPIYWPFFPVPLPMRTRYFVFLFGEDGEITYFSGLGAEEKISLLPLPSFPHGRFFETLIAMYFFPQK